MSAAPLARINDRLRKTKPFEMAASLKRRRVSYAQFGEDAHIRGFYDRLASERGIAVERGLAVDIGAFRPIVFSNTYYFYRQGWTTINVDPTPGSMLLFDAVRPRDVNLQVAVGEVEGERPFYVFGEPSVWNTMDPEAAATATARTGLVPREIAIPVMRLDTILRRHGGGMAFELLSIDAEGHDIGILRTNDFGVHRPRVVVVEVGGLSVDALASHPVVRFMRDVDYGLHSWINPNLMFVRGDSVLR